MSKFTLKFNSIVIFCFPYQDENWFRLFGKKTWIVGLFVANAPEEFVLIAAVEWRLSHNHFVEEDAKRPPINALIVFEAFDNL